MVFLMPEWWFLVALMQVIDLNFADFGHGSLFWTLFRISSHRPSIGVTPSFFDVLGNLVVWFRELYPDATVGGVASSAPVLSKENYFGEQNNLHILHT